MYIGYKMLKNGFMQVCRNIIGLDGTFLKGITHGALLVAVGKDYNNMMFPIVWAVVGGENQQPWTWFLGILCRDLNISNGLDWSFILDQQKV